MNEHDDRPKVQLPEDTGTVSGLDEVQIDAGDLQQLREVFQLRHVLPLESAAAEQAWIQPGLPASAIHAAGLAIGEPVSQRARIAPLPRKSKIRRFGLPAGLFQVRRDLQLALSQPVHRRQLGLGELSAKQEKELYRKLYEKYDERAKRVSVQAVFAHVPPEAAKSVRLSVDMRYLSFVFPANVSPRSAEAGHYYIVLQDDQNKTWSVLFRL